MRSKKQNSTTTASRKNWLMRFSTSEKYLPILAAIAAGTYPIFFYFTNNYSLINTWEHVAYFAFMFICVPAALFYLLNLLFRLKAFEKIQKYVLPFLNIFVFLFLLKVCLYAGLQKKLIVLIFVVSVVFTIFLYKHLRKVIILQLLLAVIGLLSVIPKIYGQLSYSSEWMKQPDDIESAVFVKKPNVYVVQPDGFVNFSELNKGYYNYDISEFKDFLLDQDFVNYPDFRSNYASTLASNSATFMMKHHYYNGGTSYSEAINARNLLISSNTVLDLFKKNGYITHFLAQKPYLLLNRPKMGYHKSNLSLDDVAYIGTGLGPQRDLMPHLKQFMEEDTGKPKFFFMEIFNPGHIQNLSANSRGVEEERTKWLESLDYACEQLVDYITEIKKNDPNALIIIMADHGGFVGMEYSRQIYSKTQDRDKIYSIFSSQLSIHWPNGEAPVEDQRIGTAVNLFRVLFSYLSENNAYLEKLQDNGSYVVLKDGAPQGIYQYLNDEGEVVCIKL